MIHEAVSLYRVVMDTKIINSFFRHSTKAEVDSILSRIYLSNRQSKILDLFYLKKENICFIADSLNCSQPVINRELKRIRDKILTELRQKNDNIAVYQGGIIKT